MKFPRNVYAIMHNTTKRIYVGSSCRPEARYRNHLSNLRNGKHPVEDMQADYDRHGENYTFFIVDEINSYEERKKELDWMRKLNTTSRGTGYNYKDRQVQTCLGG